MVWGKCNRFATAAPKQHLEQNGLVERYWYTITKWQNTMLLHARLNKKFFHYAFKYAQRVHDYVIPVKDLIDNKGLPTTPHFLLLGSKPNVKHFRIFRCPVVFKNMNLVTRIRESRINSHNNALEVFLLDYVMTPLDGYSML